MYLFLLFLSQHYSHLFYHKVIARFRNLTLLEKIISIKEFSITDFILREGLYQIIWKSKGNIDQLLLLIARVYDFYNLFLNVLEINILK